MSTGTTKRASWWQRFLGRETPQQAQVRALDDIVATCFRMRKGFVCAYHIGGAYNEHWRVTCLPMTAEDFDATEEQVRRPVLRPSHSPPYP